MAIKFIANHHQKKLLKPSQDFSFNFAEPNHFMNYKELQLTLPSTDVVKYFSSLKTLFLRVCILYMMW